jgi:DNA polymerase III subunit chi
MRTIEFHSGVADKTQHLLRLLRKAVGKGARVAVTGEKALLERMDAELWTSQLRDFMPHLRVTGFQSDSQPHPRMDRTPIWLVDAPAQARRCDVLVNLGPEPVRTPDDFARVIEIVATDDADRRSGRARWRHYESLGHPIEHHALAAAQDTSSGEEPSEARAST